MKITLLNKFLPVLFIVGIWFVFSSPYFLKGLVPYTSTYQVNFFAPWSHYEKFWGPVKNNAMPDVHTQIYPWKKLTIDTWKQGQIPLWNPFSFSGNPHLANFQSAALSPFNILFFVLPFIDAWSIIVLLQPLLAGLFTYALMRSFAVSKVGSLISSIAFMFCGFIVVWMAYGTLAMAIVFLPLILFAIEKSFKSNSLLSLMLLSVVLPISFFSGHFQTSLYVSIFAFSFLLYKFFVAKAYKKAYLALLFFIFGILFSMPQILPSIELYLQSVRSEIFIEGGGIPFYYLVNIFSPDFFGNPVTRNDWFGYYAEWASFVGIIPLSLAFFALFTKVKKQSLPYFFFLGGLIVLLLVIDSPLQRLIGFLQIPVFSTSNPSRIIVLFSFCFSALAGFGLDSFKEYILKKKSKKILVVFAVIGIFLLGIWLLLLTERFMSPDKVLIAKRNLLLPTALFAGSIGMIGLSLLNKKFLSLTLFYLLLAVSFDSSRFAHKWMPFDPRNLVYPKVPIIDILNKRVGIDRIYGNLGGEVTTYYGIGSIEGYDPLSIDRYGAFIRTANSGKFLKGGRSVVKLDRRAEHVDRVLDLLGVSYIFHPIPDTNQGWAYPVWEKKDKYALEYRDDKFQLFRNKTVLPRVSLFYDYEYIDNKEKILERFYSKDFDFGRTIILEEDPNITFLNIDGSTSAGNAQIVSYTPNKIQIKAKTSTPALLFLSDNYYPGWKAFVDGVETSIYRADYAFRAIILDKGNHDVEFFYDPLSFRIGVYLVIVTVVGMVVVSIVFKRRHNFKLLRFLPKP